MAGYYLLEGKLWSHLDDLHFVSRFWWLFDSITDPPCYSVALAWESLWQNHTAWWTHVANLTGLGTRFDRISVTASRDGDSGTAYSERKMFPNGSLWAGVSNEPWLCSRFDTIPYGITMKRGQIRIPAFPGDAHNGGQIDPLYWAAQLVPFANAHGTTFILPTGSIAPICVATDGTTSDLITIVPQTRLSMNTTRLPRR